MAEMTTANRRRLEMQARYEEFLARRRSEMEPLVPAPGPDYTPDPEYVAAYDHLVERLGEVPTLDQVEAYLTSNGNGPSARSGSRHVSIRYRPAVTDPG